MAKTRSQTGNITITKEEEDCKHALGLNSIAMTTRSKITKRKPSKSKHRPLPAQQVKMEEDTDTKSLLKSKSKSKSKLPKGRSVSQEQINQLIDYIVHDDMSIPKAAHRAKLSISTTRYYYNVYKNDQEKKIPSPRNRVIHPHRVYTQEQIENLIRHIVDDKTTIKEASAKANILNKSGYYYYNRYLKDPDHNIPIPYQYYTQDQKNEFIGYVVNDKMTIKAASIKANILYSTGRKYYLPYVKDRNLDIRTRQYTLDKKDGLVGDKVTTRAASRRANMAYNTGKEISSPKYLN